MAEFKISNNSSNKVVKVAVIGAGVSGLSFTNNLKKKLQSINVNYSIKHFEASNTFGGRVRPLKNFANFFMELGAEEVHGEDSEIYQIVKKHGGQPFDYWQEKELYAEYKGDLGRIEDLRKVYPEVEVSAKVYDDIMSPDSNIDYKNMNLMQYYKSQQKLELSNKKYKEL